MKLPEYKIHTFGCKVNTYDTGLIEDRLSSNYVEGKNPQIHILNTCAVTHEATQEAVRLIRKLKRKEPNAKVVVTGCSAQVDGSYFDQLEGVDLVVANSHKYKLKTLLNDLVQNEKLNEKVYRSNIFRNERLEFGGGEEEHRTRSFLKVQDGCNSFCSFCIIPFARGKSRSVPINKIIEKINSLESKGYKEVVISGIHIGDYQDPDRPDGKGRLGGMIREVVEKTNIPRIRISSLEPIEITDELLEIYQDPKMCPHFHMSIQSAQSRVLKDMKRNYGSKEVESTLLKIDKALKNSFVGMDVIAGFPGESDEEFIETYDRLNSLPWTRLHVFPYSIRKGTKSARMEEVFVPRDIIKNRALKLRKLSSKRYEENAKNQIGKTKSVLVLENGEGVCEDYWPVIFSGDQPSSNSIVSKPILSYEPPTDSRMIGRHRV